MLRSLIVTEVLAWTGIPDGSAAHAPRRGDGLLSLWEETRADRRLAVFAFAAPMALFFVELTRYTLSVDENLQQYQSDVPREWLVQGRLGMALLEELSPPLHSIASPSQEVALGSGTGEGSCMFWL